MKPSIFIPLISLLFICHSVFAQDVLKLSKRKPVYYFKGNNITVQLNPDKEIITGEIDSIKNNFIVVNGNIIPVKDICAVYLKRDKLNIFSRGLILSGIGIGFLVLVGVNTLVTGINSFSPTVFVDSGVLFFGGIILYRLRIKKININQRHTLKTVGIGK